MAKKIISVMVLFAFCLLSSMPVYADTRDDEIRELKKLVNQLTRRIDKLERGQRDTKEIAREIATEEAERVAKKTSGLPKWIQNTKFKGDVRVRNEQIWNEPGTNNSRQRVRFRYGFETEVTDKVKAGARLATGGQAVTTTNIDLDDSFEHPDIAIDLAYMEFTPYDWVMLTAGIFKNPYYRTDDLIWDSDVTFQGAAGKLSTDLERLGMENAPPTDLFLVYGAHPLESAGPLSHDPWLMAVQGGFKSKLFDEKVSLGVATGYYDFIQTQHATLGHRENDNTNRGDGTFAYDYNVLGINGELEVKDVLSLGSWETPLALNCDNIPIAVFGDFVHNNAVDDEDIGWLIGGRIGPKKFKKKGQWHVKYNYRVLEKDAFMDIFPDGDPQSGGTNLRSHEVLAYYSLLDNVIVGIDYYKTKEDSGTGNDQDIIQADILVKF